MTSRSGRPGIEHATQLRLTRFLELREISAPHGSGGFDDELQRDGLERRDVDRLGVAPSILYAIANMPVLVELISATSRHVG